MSAHKLGNGRETGAGAQAEGRLAVGERDVVLESAGGNLIGEVFSGEGAEQLEHAHGFGGVVARFAVFKQAPPHAEYHGADG